MTIDPAHLVGTGGALGAILRYSVGELIEAETLPIGTLTVNVLGSFGLGLLTFFGLGDQALLLLGTGVCGAFTTFSSFSFETVRLWESGERVGAVANAFGTLAGAGIALVLAWLLARAIGGA